MKCHTPPCPPPVNLPGGLPSRPGPTPSHLPCCTPQHMPYIPPRTFAAPSKMAGAPLLRGSNGSLPRPAPFFPVSNRVTTSLHHGGPPYALAMPASSPKSNHGKLTSTACPGPLIPWSGLRAPQPWNGVNLPREGASTTLKPPASATLYSSSGVSKAEVGATFALSSLHTPAKWKMSLLSSVASRVWSCSSPLPHALLTSRKAPSASLHLKTPCPPPSSTLQRHYTGTSPPILTPFLRQIPRTPLLISRPSLLGQHSKLALIPLLLLSPRDPGVRPILRPLAPLGCPL